MKSRDSHVFVHESLCSSSLWRETDQNMNFMRRASEIDDSDAHYSCETSLVRARARNAARFVRHEMNEIHKKN